MSRVSEGRWRGRGSWPACRAPAWPPLRPLRPGTSLLVGRCPSRRGRSSWLGWRACAGSPRPLGRAAHRGRARPTSGSPRASATARTGSGRWTSTAASSRGRVSEIAGPEGLPIDRLMLTLGIRRTAEREAEALDPELRALLERFCEGVNAAAASAKALPFEMQLLRLEWEPWRPADMLGLGKLLAFGLSTNWERELLRADMAARARPGAGGQARPRLPGRQSGRHPGSRGTGEGLGAGRADRRRAPLDRPGGRGQRLQQLGGQRGRSARPARR